MTRLMGKSTQSRMDGSRYNEALVFFLSFERAEEGREWKENVRARHNGGAAVVVGGSQKRAKEPITKPHFNLPPTSTPRYPPVLALHGRLAHRPLRLL